MIRGETMMLIMSMERMPTTFITALLLSFALITLTTFPTTFSSPAGPRVLSVQEAQGYCRAHQEADAVCGAAAPPAPVGRRHPRQRHVRERPADEQHEEEQGPQAKEMRSDDHDGDDDDDDDDYGDETTFTNQDAIIDLATTIRSRILDDDAPARPSSDTAMNVLPNIFIFGPEHDQNLSRAVICYF